MRKLVSWALALTLATPMLLCLHLMAQSTTPVAAKKPAAKKKKSTGKKATVRKGATKKAPAKSAGAAQASAANKSRTATNNATRPKPNGGKSSTASKRKGKKPVTRTSWRNRQLTPSTDRYKEIQQALAAKGFLKPEAATGQWDANSMAALKKFQTEQNIDASGKLNSLSLIALGLGPKRDLTASASVPPSAASQPGTN